MMKTIISKIILFTCLCAGTVSAQVTGTPYIVPQMNDMNLCAGLDTKGTDFWLTFGKNSSIAVADTSRLYFQINISADAATDVTLTFTEDNYSATYPVNSNSLLSIDLGNVQNHNELSAVYQAGATGSNNKSLHITSTQPISVYAFNTSSATTDASTILPVEAWGTEYYRLSYPPNGSSSDVEMIIANEATTVTTPTGTINLAAGQVYCYSSSLDMTGRHITSDKPVAYFSHVSSAQVPVGRIYADILFEQMLPVKEWGTEFLVPNAPEDINNMNNHIRIIASKDATTINFVGATVVTADVRTPPVPIAGETIIASGGTLDAGQWVELQIDGNNSSSCYIKADKSIGVAAYMTGGTTSTTSGKNGGDPSIAWISPLNQSLANVIIAPFIFPSDVDNPHTNLDSPDAIHYMIIITSTPTKGQTTINGTTIGTDGWTADAFSGYSYYLYQFDKVNDLNKSFNIANPTGLIVLCGGTAPAETYYYAAGSGVCTINQ